ncbi:MAG TPA: hypothetical protein VFG51_03760 [Candidatus Saccharimonadia bacterium]|nr:hypothetical protein [Candidatus Saccharimonadia bacterium]
MKKNWVVLAVVAILLVGGGVFAFTKMKGGASKVAPSGTPKPKLSLPVNVIPVSDRPFVTLTPTAAREVVIGVDKLKKQSDSVDFELEYSAIDKQEAAIGSLQLSGSAPFHKTLLLGSESAGGKITYHEGVTGGTLTLTFYNENYKLANDWAYIDNRKPTTGIFSARDGKFDIDTAKLLKNAQFVIVFNNPGLPATEDKALLAGPYTIDATSGLPTGKANVKMHLSEAKPATILGWNGTSWKEFTTKTDGQTATATVDLMSTYIAVVK